MSDELECFRRAMDLGCPDFALSMEGKLSLLQFELGDADDSNPSFLYLPSPSQRVNRQASAVCAEWWMDWCASKDNSLEYYGESRRMIESARAFRKTYGATS